MLIFDTPQTHLVVVVGCVAATTTVAAVAYSSTGRRQSIGSLHGAARLLKRQGARGLWRGVMDVVEEVVSIAVAVAVAVTVAVLRTAGLLRGRGLQAA